MNKQKFIITIFIVIIVCLLKINVYAEDILYGDTDGNGKVEMDDIITLTRYLANNIELDLNSQKRSDVDRDNKVTQNDLRLIQAYLVELITLPVKMGDVNEDGIIDETDKEIILQEANNIETSYQTMFADLNGDDEITIMDVTIINDFLNGSIKVLPQISEGKVIEEETDTDINPSPSQKSTSTAETKDEEEVVNVEDTLAKIPMIITIITIVLATIGGILITTTLINNKNKKVD